MTDLQTNILDQRQQLLEVLPEKIAHIAKCWAHLSKNRWDPQSATELFVYTQKLAELSEQLDLFQISETLFSFEVYLSSFVDSELYPNNEQIEDANRLLKILQHTCENFELSEVISFSDEEDDIDLPVQPLQRIFYLRAGIDKAPELVPSLENLGCSILTFIHADDLLAELDKAPPQVLIFDIQLLPSMKQIIEVIKRHNKNNTQPIKSLCLSHSNDVKLSLQATRSGAQAYYAQPFDIEQICKKIINLATPLEDRPYRVVVVDDDPAQADFSASILKKAEFEVASVIQPLDVLDVIYEFKPDLILMDLYMPDANGIELTTAIRTHSEFVTTPIVFLSGEQNADKQLSALSVGGDDFIAKPIRPNRLITSIRNRIKRHHELQRHSGEISHENSNRPLLLSENGTAATTNGLLKRDQLFSQLSELLSSELSDHYCTGIIHFEIGNLDELREAVDRNKIDELVTAIGQYLIAHKKSDDVVAKLGDSVFAILAQRQDESAVKTFAEWLLNTIKENSFNIDSFRLSPVCHIGIKFVDTHTSNVATLISECEQASQQAKRAGENQVVIYLDSPEPEIEDSATSHFITPLHDALRNESFQTISRIFDKQDGGEEIKQLALMLPSNEGTLHNETEFLPAAKEAGLIEDFDRLVMRQALSLLDFNRHQGKAITILINQSHESLIDKGRSSWLREQLRTRQIVGSGLILGFNLADLANDLATAKNQIEAFQAMGVAIAILRFKPKNSALKVLRFLEAEYVVMSRKYLGLDQERVENFVRHAHSYHAQVIIPHVSSARIPTQHWLQVADYCQKKSATLTKS